ncbi:MAG: pilus assembly protein TadG-related protein [Methylocella sp.]
MKRDMKSFFGRLRGDQSGVVVILAALTMVSVVGFTGFAVDVGNVYYAKSKLQAATDAAALAGAQSINAGSGGTTISTATSYSATAGQINASTKFPATMASGYPALKCLTSIGVSCSGPDSANAIEVKQNATVPLYFGEVLGLKAWQISATSLAGAKGGAGGTQTLDVMIIVDTTVSMNDADTTCGISGGTKEDCAMAGVRTLLSYYAGPPISGLWPCSLSLANCGAAVSGNVANPVDRVGLMVFPGVTNAAQIPSDYDCSSSEPKIAAYNASPVYQIVPFSSDYRTSGTAASLNTSSDLVLAARGGKAGCTEGITAEGGVGTYYADAVTAAQAALASSGRATAQKVIIVLSDGDASASSSNMPAGKYHNQCQEAITAAKAATAAGTWVYTIAYQALTSGSCSTDSPAISACSTLQQMASDSTKFFSDTVGGASTCTSAANSTSNLNTIFQAIALQASKNASGARLLPLTTT